MSFIVYICFFLYAGDIPHELSALSNLKVLYLNNNGLSGKACLCFFFAGGWAGGRGGWGGVSCGMFLPYIAVMRQPLVLLD